MSGASTPCPPIGSGEGHVVTGRFITRHAANWVRIRLEDGDEIVATETHPVCLLTGSHPILPEV